MNEEEWKVIDSLRSQGYAVAIFNPEELNGTSQKVVEDGMVASGWDVITLMGVGDEQEDDE